MDATVIIADFSTLSMLQQDRRRVLLEASDSPRPEGESAHQKTRSFTSSETGERHNAPSSLGHRVDSLTDAQVHSHRLEVLTDRYQEARVHGTGQVEEQVGVLAEEDYNGYKKRRQTRPTCQLPGGAPRHGVPARRNCS